jgi:pimeloyl-ACP methyl ester carboxylesterase
MTATRTPGDDFREGVVELPGVSLHYVERGAGRPVVLLHGFTDSWHSFRLVLPALSDHARCLAYDHRGHGRSSRPGTGYSADAFATDAVGFVEALGLGRVALVGHSMGGLVARKVALARPDLVERLVLVAAPLWIDNTAVRLMEADLARFGPAVPRAFAEEFQAACVCDRGAVPKWFFDACVDASAGVPPRVWREALAGMLADDHAGRLGEIRCPALVLGGKQDAFFGPHEQAELARALSRGRLLLYDGVGHSPHWEMPERFAADVAAFLAEAT